MKITMNEKKGYIYSEQLSLYGRREVIGFGDNDFFVKEIDRDLANDVVVNNHYSGKIYNASYIHLGVFINNCFIGVIQYGYAMNPQSMNKVVKGTGINEYLELNRMWISDKAARNSESKAISYSIKYIKAVYPKVKWVQSFADERCGGYGIVYQAANFKYYGEHTSIFWTLDDQVYHNSLMTRNPKLSKSAAHLQENKDKAISQALRQFRYIYFINQACIKDCLLKEQPYPKHYLKTA